MDRLEAMTILLAAVDSGSLSKASRQLRIPLATVSRRVAELEAHLKIRLLLRGNRKLTLTDAGRDYVASCRRIVEEIAEVERAAAGEYRKPQGELVVTVPFAFGRSHVVPVVVEFLRAYPDIRVSVLQTDRVVSLVEEHVDLAMRIGSLPDSSMIATRVGLIRPILCASPSYLKARGLPEKPADLVAHEGVVYGAYAGGDKWQFLVDGVLQEMLIPWRLKVTTAEAAVAAATVDAGIARVLSYLIVDHMKSGALVSLLERYETEPIPLSLVYPGQRQVPLKLRAFLDFAVPRLRERLMDA